MLHNGFPFAKLYFCCVYFHKDSCYVSIDLFLDQGTSAARFLAKLDGLGVNRLVEVHRQIGDVNDGAKVPALPQQLHQHGKEEGPTKLCRRARPRLKIARGGGRMSRVA